MSTASADVRDEVVDVCDGRLHIHVKVAGDGPPVVFFHPLPGLEWQPFLDRLAEHHTVYAPEHPGTSPGDLAASFPEALSRLVLLSPIGLWRDDAPIRLVEMVTGPPEDLPGYLFKHPESEAAQAVMAMPDDPDLLPKAIAQTAWNIGCTTKFAWPIADHGLARRLHRIGVPTLVVWGRDDALVPVAYAEEFASRIAGSRVEVLDDCGHAMQGDQPEQMFDSIAKFLG
jgi:pimeloyl-ACP methyl ester carboxylesterase